MRSTREAAILAHVPLARELSRRAYKYNYERLRGMTPDDLFQEGMLGVIKGVDARGTKTDEHFQNYMRSKIRGAISEALRHEPHAGSKAQRRGVWFDEVKEDAKIAPDPSDQYMAKLLVNELLRPFDDPYRVIMTSNYYGISDAQVGARFGLQNYTISHRRRRVIAKLRSTLAQAAIFVIVVLWGVGAANCQTWTKLGSVPLAPPYMRAYQKAVFDSVKGRLLIPEADPNCCFGLGSNALYWYPWEKAWSSGTTGSASVDSLSAPADRRYYHQMAYDTKRNVLWTYGPGDFYKFDVATQVWSQICGNVTIACTQSLKDPEGSMAYDSQSDKVIMFGGGLNGTAGFSTIIYDPVAGGFSISCSGSCAIPGLYGPGLVALGASGKILLFGGNNGSTLSNETYIFDTATQAWLVVNSTVSPPAQKFPILDWVPSLGKVILIGREQPNTHVWSFDPTASQWSDMGIAGGPTLPTSPQSSTGAFNATTGGFIVIGYLSGVWNLQLVGGPPPPPPPPPPVASTSLVIANLMNPIYSMVFSSFRAGLDKAQQPVMLVSRGPGTPLTIHSIRVVGDPDFTVTSQCGATLDLGKSCNVIVVFAPTIVGQRNAQLQIDTDAPESPLLVTLSGVAVAP